MNLDPTANHPDFSMVVSALSDDDKPRTDFLKACLLKLGLKVNLDQDAVPSLSRLHLSSFTPSDIAELVSSFQTIISIEDGEEYIKDDNDTFHLERPSAWSSGTHKNAVVDEEGNDASNSDGDDRIVDYNKIVKRLIAHEDNLPASRETPYFNHNAYFANLKHYQSNTKEVDPEFGKHLLYGEVVTSTNTMLEKSSHPIFSYPRIPS